MYDVVLLTLGSERDAPGGCGSGGACCGGATGAASPTTHAYCPVAGMLAVKMPLSWASASDASARHARACSSHCANVMSVPAFRFSAFGDDSAAAVANVTP